MKIAVLGTGAMGSVYAGLLGAGDNEVWAVDPWREHMAAIEEHGLRVEGASGDRVTRIRATTDPGETGICDLVIVATKAAQVIDAARSASPLLGPGTTVLTIQNGLGAAERLATVIPAAHIVVGVAGGFGSSIVEPGRVHHHNMQLIRIGEMHGAITHRVRRLEELWRTAGFTVQAYDDINQLVWEKFICNCTFSGPCTVLRRTFAEVMEDEHAWGVARACGLEAYAAGRAKGVSFSFGDPVDYITRFGACMPDARPSMLLDHLAGRRSEIDAINGMVPVVAREVGTAAPVNEVVVALVRALERNFA
jgi:2-dehydropantoate 2-reductase